MKLMNSNHPGVSFLHCGCDCDFRRGKGGKHKQIVNENYWKISFRLPSLENIFRCVKHDETQLLLKFSVEVALCASREVVCRMVSKHTLKFLLNCPWSSFSLDYSWSSPWTLLWISPLEIPIVTCLLKQPRDLPLKLTPPQMASIIFPLCPLKRCYTWASKTILKKISEVFRFKRNKILRYYTATSET